MSSAGVGLHWNTGKDIKAELYFSKALNKNQLFNSKNRHNFQDKEIYFQLSSPISW